MAENELPTWPSLGHGLGLRTAHYEAILRERPNVDWFEALTENYLVAGGKPLHFLDRIAECYPIVLHGVSMSIGGVDPLNMAYLKKVKALAERVQARWISDHLCWTSFGGHNSHDLLPLPYTQEALQHVSDRISRVQDVLEQRFLIENVSSYVAYDASSMPEWVFLSELCQRSDCLLLLDVNNIYVSAFNHGFSPADFIEGVPADRIQQVHVAGHTNNGDHIIDTHDHPVIDEVWNLYRDACARFGSVSTLIERDDNIPPINELLNELNRARDIQRANVKRGCAA